MELGEKLRQARLDAGLSQRQLCGEEITRNMLSQIEHGAARPSMKTLRYLAARLGKNVGYFLDEEAAASPNQDLMESARRLYDGADYAGAALVLEGYQGPDPIFDREKGLLWVLCHLELAALAIAENRGTYAKALLDKAAAETAYCSEELRRRRLLLLGRLQIEACAQLPSLDEELLLRGEYALSIEQPERALHLLEAVQNQASSRWQLLRGRASLGMGNYREAARYFHQAEPAFPKETAAYLEQCYRELEDYKRAYEYACKQKGKP